MRWQQRQRDESREDNRNRLERHPQGEHSGQRNDRETTNRWESDPGQTYAYPRQSNYDEYDSRYDMHSHPDENREWVSGTGQPPYRYNSRDVPYAGSPMSYQEQQESRSDNPYYQNYRPSEKKQSFAGRGPQGYKRSDDRITEDINEALTRDHDVDASNLSVETKNGEVVLKGTLSDRDAKRRAEEIAEACSGVQDVQNQIRIKREENSDSGREARDDKTDARRTTKLAS